MRFVRSSVLAIGFVGLLSACGGSSKDESTTPAANPCAAPAETTPTEGGETPPADGTETAPADGTANPCAPAEGGGGW